MTTSLSKLAVGDRVRAKNVPTVGPPFRGLYGTVVHVDTNERWAAVRVKFDNPPSPFEPDGIYGGHGGGWDRENLARVEHEHLDVVSYTELDAEREKRRQAEFALELERERTAALIREKTEAEAQVEDLKQTLDVLQATLEYARRFLDEEDNAHVTGFSEGYAARDVGLPVDL